MYTAQVQMNFKTKIIEFKNRNIILKYMTVNFIKDAA